ncbi:MAG: UbiA family prenyltransferase [Methanocellales archaeon]
MKLEMKKLKAIWQLTRLEHGLMFALGVIVGIAVANSPSITLYNVFFGALTAILIEVGTFALNDYFDLEVDKVNKRFDRPLVRGDLTPKTALAIALISTPLGVLSSFFLNWLCFSIALISALFGVLYDVRLKETGFFGNIYIAYSMAIPFIFGGAIARKLPSILLLLASIAFLSGLGREIMKGVMDVEGDKLRRVRSIARIYGEVKAAQISSAFYLIAIALSFIPYFYPNTNYFYNEFYLIFILPSNLLFIYASYNLLQKYSTASKMRGITLMAILLGLLGFLAGSVFYI